MPCDLRSWEVYKEENDMQERKQRRFARAKNRDKCGKKEKEGKWDLQGKKETK